MGPVEVKQDDPYIRRCPTLTDFIFIGSATDEYNLNIFVGIDEFEKPDE
jgi:hypothetical protein